jgi:hypothetical protein
MLSQYYTEVSIPQNRKKSRKIERGLVSKWDWGKLGVVSKRDGADVGWTAKRSANCFFLARCSYG